MSRDSTTAHLALSLMEERISPDNLPKARARIVGLVAKGEARRGDISEAYEVYTDAYNQVWGKWLLGEGVAPLDLTKAEGLAVCALGIACGADLEDHPLTLHIMVLIMSILSYAAHVCGDPPGEMWKRVNAEADRLAYPVRDTLDSETLRSLIWFDPTTEWLSADGEAPASTFVPPLLYQLSGSSCDAGKRHEQESAASSSPTLAKHAPPDPAARIVGLPHPVASATTSADRAARTHLCTLTWGENRSDVYWDGSCLVTGSDAPVSWASLSLENPGVRVVWASEAIESWYKRELGPYLERTVGREVHLGVRDITSAQFRAVVIGSSRPVLVNFWAPWCGSCRQIEPVLKEIAAEYPGLTVVRLNVDENPAIATECGVPYLPTQIVFEGGRIVKKVVGYQTKSWWVHALAPWLH